MMLLILISMVRNVLLVNWEKIRKVLKEDL